MDLQIYRGSRGQGDWGGAYHRGCCKGGDGVDGVVGEEELIGRRVVRQLVLLDEVGAEQNVLRKPTDDEEMMLEGAALHGDREAIKAFDIQRLAINGRQGHMRSRDRVGTEGHRNGTEGFIRQKAHLCPGVIKAGKLAPLQVAGDLGPRTWSEDGGEAGDGEDR